MTRAPLIFNAFPSLIFPFSLWDASEFTDIAHSQVNMETS